MPNPILIFVILYSIFKYFVISFHSNEYKNVFPRGILVFFNFYISLSEVKFFLYKKKNSIIYSIIYYLFFVIIQNNKKFEK